MRIRRLAVPPILLLALGALGACGNGDAAAPSKPATAADRGEVLTTGVPSSAPSVTPTRATPSPTTGATPSASTPDGVTYGLITRASDTSLTYDKIDYDRKACDALAPKQPVPVAVGFAACFSNVNPLTRTVPMSAKVEILAIREGDPPVGLAPDELEVFLQSPSNTAPPRYSSFAITVAAGKVTRIEQFGVSHA